MAGEDDGQDASWHLDKRVPIALVGAILIQTFTLGWWSASMSYRISALEQASPSSVAEFSKLEAAREATNLAVARIETKMDSLLSIARRLDSKAVGAPADPTLGR